MYLVWLDRSVPEAASKESMLYRVGGGGWGYVGEEVEVWMVRRRESKASQSPPPPPLPPPPPPPPPLRRLVFKPTDAAMNITVSGC